MAKSKNINPQDNGMPTDHIMREVECIKRLREDVLLLRFYLARRTDLSKIIDPGDRLSSEAALKSSLEIISNVEHGKMPPIGHISAASSALLDSIDRLVTAARMAQEQDGTGEEPLPITPESLRSSLPQSDIDHAIGTVSTKRKLRETAPEVRVYIMQKCFWTFLWFVIAVCVHTATVVSFKECLPSFTPGAFVETIKDIFEDNSESKKASSNNPETLSKNEEKQKQEDTSESRKGSSNNPEISSKNKEKEKQKVIIANFLIPISGFFWALVGSNVYILMRFRRFGAAYAFDPALAKIFKARILSGSIITSVLLYFIFGGEDPWAQNWEVNLPLWGFVVGYAGKLQVELLRRMVERVQSAILNVAGTNNRDRQRNLSDQKDATDENATLATAGIPREPRTKDPEVEKAEKSSEREKPEGRDES